MKRPLLIILLLVLAKLGSAQSRDDKSFKELTPDRPLSESKLLLGIQMGPSIPLADFGEIDINDEKAGLGKTGIQIRGNLQYLFTESFYGLVEAGYSSNPIDEDELIVSITNVVPSFVRVSASSKSWNATTWNVGVGTRTQLDDKTFFLTKFSFGLQNMSAPSYLITLTDGSTTQVVSQSSASSNNINLLLGGSIMTEISSTSYFTIGIDYLRSSHEFEDVKVNNTVNGSRIGPTETFEYEQDIEMVSITIGLSFKI